MKYLVPVFVFLFIHLATTQAQSISEYGAPEERAGRMTERMEEELPLRSAQVKAIYALNLKYARRIQREVIDTDMNKLSGYFRIRSINKEKEEELLPLLDSRQKEQYEKMKVEATRELLARFF
ncbi:MAG: hypothetical protein KDD01_05055 [Phaeodactylibacter sp.]|nr:hypothetical protein [Phaeodactylibacter sp.]